VAVFATYLGSYSTGLRASVVPRLSADKPIVFDGKTKCSTAEGNAALRHKNMLIESDRIRYLTEAQRSFAEGRVRLNRDCLRLVAHNAEYNFNDQTIDVKNFRLSVGTHTIDGPHLSGPMDTLVGRNVRVRLGEPNPFFGLSFDAKKAVIKKEQYIQMNDVLVRIGPMPVFITPYYRHSLQPSVVRFKSEMGLIKRNRDLGRYVRNDIFFDLGWPIKPGLMFDAYRNRGALLGPMLEYELDHSVGKLRAAKIPDKRHDRFRDTNGEALERRRFFVDWPHRSHFGDSFDYIHQFKWQRDSKVVKDFRPALYDGSNQHPDNFAELSHRGTDTVTSVTTRFRPNRFQRIQERLPEFRHDHLPVRIKDTPFYGQYGVGVARLREKSVYVPNRQGTEMKAQRLDVSAGLSSPIALGNAAVITPVTGVRVLNYSGMVTHSSYSRALAQIGLDLKLRCFGDYDYTSDYWNIHQLRHVFQPVVQYRYIPSTQSTTNRITTVDRSVNSENPTLEELDLISRRDVDSLRNMNVLRTGLENFVYTNFKNGVPHQWLKVNVYQDFNLAHDKNERTLSDSFLWTEWAPASFLSFNTYSRFDTTNKRIKEFTGGTTFNDGDLWRCSINHTYRVDKFHQSTVSFTYKLTARYTFSIAFGIDEFKRDLSFQTYTFSALLGQTWKMDWQFKWKKRSLASRTANKSSWEVDWIITVLNF
jgi:hypothetical protein